MATKQEVSRGWALYCDRTCRNAARQVFQGHSKGSGPIFDIRKASGLTQKQFAEQVGVSKSLIEKCERKGQWPGNAEAREKIQDWVDDTQRGGVMLTNSDS